LIESTRYLAALNEYSVLTDSLSKEPIELQHIVQELIDGDTPLQTMRARAEKITQTLEFEHDSDDWILGAEMFGIVTHYRKCEDDPTSIVVKIEGTMNDLPVFEQLAVFYEIGLYKDWAPFCTASELIDLHGKAELLRYFLFCYIYIF
jgi:hypothetical protein